MAAVDAKAGLDCFVIDAGAHTVRAGRAEDFPAEAQTPYVVLPSVVREATENGTVERRIFDADGCLEHWDGLDSLLSHVLYDVLGWPEGDEGYVVATETPLATSRTSRERATQLMFETFNVRGYYVLDSAVASMYAAGKLQGVTVDIGYTGTVVSQIVDGAAVLGASQRIPVGGAYLDRLLCKLLSGRELSMPVTSAARLKELCMCVSASAVEFASQQFINELETKEYELPDGLKVSIKQEGHQLGEALFTGVNGAGTHKDGLTESAFAAATAASDPVQRAGVLGNVLLCGGGASVPGLGPRLHQELKVLLPPTTGPGIISVPAYMPKRSAHYASYAGAAVVGKGINVGHLMSKEDYDEYGPSYIHRKC